MLHGEVKVNDYEIAKWTAVNTTEVIDHDVVYKCRVAGRDIQGYPYEHSFTVLHKPSDGPPSLVRSIMQEAITTTFTKG